MRLRSSVDNVLTVERPLNVFVRDRGWAVDVLENSDGPDSHLTQGIGGDVPCFTAKTFFDSGISQQ